VELTLKINNDDGVPISANTQDLVLLLNAQYVKKNTNVKIHQDIARIIAGKLNEFLK